MSTDSAVTFSDGPLDGHTRRVPDELTVIRAVDDLGRIWDYPRAADSSSAWPGQVSDSPAKLLT